MAMERASLTDAKKKFNQHLFFLQVDRTKKNYFEDESKAVDVRDKVRVHSLMTSQTH